MALHLKVKATSAYTEHVNSSLCGFENSILHAHRPKENGHSEHFSKKEEEMGQWHQNDFISFYMHICLKIFSIYVFFTFYTLYYVIVLKQLNISGAT